MTTYRLPEGLSEVVAIPPSPLFLPIEVGGEPGLLVAVPNTTIRMIVPVSCLTEVPPPLPPIPDALAVAIGDHVFARDDDSHPVFICPGGGVCHITMTWSELNELASKEGKPIVALVPDPAVDAPALPWEHIDHDEDRLVIDEFMQDDFAAHVKTSSGGVVLTASKAEQAGLALLSIARAARDAPRTQPTTKEG